MKRPYVPDSDPPSLDDVKACIEKRLFVGSLPAGATEMELRDVSS